MYVISLSLIICVIAVKCLFSARPPLFQLTENVFGKGTLDKRDYRKDLCVKSQKKMRR